MSEAPPAQPARRSTAGPSALWLAVPAVVVVLAAVGAVVVYQAWRQGALGGGGAATTSIPQTIAQTTGSVGTPTPGPPESGLVEEDVTVVRQATPEPQPTPPAGATATPAPVSLATPPPAPATGVSTPAAPPSTLARTGTTPLVTLPQGTQPLPTPPPSRVPTPRPTAVPTAAPTPTPPPAGARRSLVAGRTELRSGREAKQSMSGFDTGGIGVQDKPEIQARIEFQTEPSSVRPGDRFELRAYIVNEGKKSKIEQVVVTETSSQGRSGGPTNMTRDLDPRDRVLLYERSGVWPDVTSWSLEVLVVGKKGDTCRATLVLRP